MNDQRVLITATKTLSREIGESGVRSNAILPGSSRPLSAARLSHAVVARTADPLRNRPNAQRAFVGLRGRSPVTGCAAASAGLLPFAVQCL